jgi:plastocyanin
MGQLDPAKASVVHSFVHFFTSQNKKIANHSGFQELPGIFLRRKRYGWRKTRAAAFGAVTAKYLGPNKKETGMTRPMQKIGSLGVLMLLAGLLAGCGGNPAESNSEGERALPSVSSAERSGPAGSMVQVTAAEAAPNSGPQQITIDNFSFSPAKLTVSVGSQVTWVNHDDVPHTVTSSAQPKLFHSGTMDTDDQFSHTFTTPGTYDYFCALHPKMTAQIIVK